MPFIALKNIKLYYEMYGDKTHLNTLLFIHGLGASGRDWENQLNYFKAHYQILVVDLRGHGKSDKPNLPYSISLFTDDISQLLQQLALKKLHVIGHSLGGMIAFELALSHPDLVQSLTIINSAPKVEFPSLAFKLNFYLRFLSVKLFGMKKLSKTLANRVFPKPEQSQLREIFISRWLENDPQAYLNALKAFPGWDVMEKLPSLLCPTLIMTGDRDYTSIAYKQSYMRRIPNASMVIIPDSGHLTIVDQSSACNQALKDFLTKTSRSL